MLARFRMRAMEVRCFGLRRPFLRRGLSKTWSAILSRENGGGLASTATGVAAFVRRSHFYFLAFITSNQTPTTREGLSHNNDLLVSEARALAQHAAD